MLNQNKKKEETYQSISRVSASIARGGNWRAGVLQWLGCQVYCQISNKNKNKSNEIKSQKKAKTETETVDWRLETENKEKEM